MVLYHLTPLQALSRSGILLTFVLIALLASLANRDWIWRRWFLTLAAMGLIPFALTLLLMSGAYFASSAGMSKVYAGCISDVWQETHREGRLRYLHFYVGQDAFVVSNSDWNIGPKLTDNLASSIEGRPAAKVVTVAHIIVDISAEPSPLRCAGAATARD